MGLLIPASRQDGSESNFSGRPSATWGTLLTGGVAHTLGAKTTLIASTLKEYTRIRIEFADTFISATLTDALSNIYIGAAAAESVIIPNLLCGWTSTVAQGPGATFYDFPIRIARGTRISADLQGLIASETAYIRVTLSNDRMFDWCGSKVETLGAVTASSRGTQVTPGGAAEGTFTAIGTSGRKYGYIQPMCIGNTDITATVGLQALDIGTGSAALVGLENFVFAVSASEFFSNLEAGRLVTIPSGTALQARLQSHTTDIEAKSVIFYGAY